MDKDRKKVRLLDTGHLSASENMALDAAILQAREENLVPDTLRFLSFKPHCALIGSFQSAERELRLDYCNANSIEINRRITGGGALYWNESDIGWEYFGARESFDSGSCYDSYYEMFCSAAAEGINKFNIKASYRPRNDIEVSGRKISGSGGTSGKNAFMFQGTLLVDLDIDIMLRALRVPTEKLKYSEINSLKDRITWLAREAGYCPSRSEIIKNLAEGFEEYLGISTYPGELCPEEKKLFDRNLAYFKSDEHIYKNRQKDNSSYIYSYHKSEKKVMRCAANVDTKRKILKNVYFTGDFFCYPGRAVYDLESLLKNLHIGTSSACPNMKSGGNKINEVLDSFFNGYGKISGISKTLIKELLEKSFSRLDFLQYGIPFENINDINTVCSDFNAGNKIDTFLIPYCAKHPDCIYRYAQGCDFCGLCSVGDAIKLAERFGISHITITSFEHLCITLEKIKKEGSSYFAGCCCEAFYLKHLQHFEEIKMPGILLNIDNTTCYDLGKENEAYAGRFEGFTDLKLKLLEKIFKLLR